MLDKRNSINYNSKIVSGNNKSLSLFLLINKFFWKSIVGPIFSIFVPLLFMTLFYVLAIAKDRPHSFTNTYSGILVFTIFPICFFSLNSTNLEFRKSIILKKLKNEDFSKIKYISILIGYYAMIITLFTLINSLIFFLFCTNPTEYKIEVAPNIFVTYTFKSLLEKINYLSLIVSIVLMMCQTISFALLISILINNSVGSQFIGFGIMMVTLLLSGQIIPLMQWIDIEFLKYLTFINPIGYVVNSMNIATILTETPSMNNIFNFTENVVLIYKNGRDGIVFYNWAKPIFVFTPIILTTLFVFLETKLFKWSNR